MSCIITVVVERNWSGTYTFGAHTVHRPRSLEELQELVAGSPETLHALGTRHSFNDVADAAALVSLADLPGEVALDSQHATVRVPAAMRYGDLARQLQDAGWALANLASLPHITVGGSVATATHGSGNRNQSLAAAVRGLTLVDGRGELVQLDAGSPDFAGAVVGLGALGVVTDLTLAVEPTFEVRQDLYEHLSWDTLLSQFADVTGAGYSVSVVTQFSEDEAGLLWVKTRLTDGDPGEMPAELFGAPAATEKLHMTRGNDPRYCTPQLGEPGAWCDRLPHFLLEFTPSSGAEIQSEYLMDRTHATAAIEALRGVTDRILPLLRSAEIRTVAAEDLWLSSASALDVFGVHFTWQPDVLGVDSAVREIEAALAPFAPRPHWGKAFTDGHDWAGLYPRLADFQDLVGRFDPRGTFRSPFLERTVLSSP